MLRHKTYGTFGLSKTYSSLVALRMTGAGIGMLCYRERKSGSDTPFSANALREPLVVSICCYCNLHRVAIRVEEAAILRATVLCT
jgi:hypothetical protein